MPHPLLFLGALGIIGIILVLAIIALVIWAFIFWILMIVDCAKRKLDDTEKIIWILVIVLLHILGALIYYFAVKYNDKSNRKR